MNDSAKTKVLCLGLGDLWLTEWLAREDVAVVGVVDIYGELSQWEQEDQRLPDYWPHLKVFMEPAAALNELRPDLVTMVTPPDRKTDMDAIEQAVGLGYDVFLEKLRPANAADGERLKRLSERSGKFIGIGQSYIFNKHIARTKQLLTERLLGEIEEVVYTCHMPVVDAEWMKAYKHVMLEDLTYHHLGVIHYLIDFPCMNVYARSSTPAWSIQKSPGVVSMIAESKQGVRLNYYSSWVAHGRTTDWLGEFRIEGSEGSLHYEKEELLYVNKQGECSVVAPIEPFPNPYARGMIQSFLDTARNRTSSELTIDRFYPVIQMIYAALESAEGDAVVSL